MEKKNYKEEYLLPSLFWKTHFHWFSILKVGSRLKTLFETLCAPTSIFLLQLFRKRIIGFLPPSKFEGMVSQKYGGGQKVTSNRANSYFLCSPFPLGSFVFSLIRKMFKGTEGVQPKEKERSSHKRCIFLLYKCNKSLSIFSRRNMETG